MINLSASISIFYLILFFTIAGFFAYYVYKITIPEIPKSKKILLIILRSLSISLVLLLLFEPLLTFLNKFEEEPVLAVLVDNSKSMSITDKTGIRTEQLKKIFDKGIFNQINKAGKVEFITFGNKTKIHENLNPDSLPFDNAETNLSKAIEDVKKLSERKNIKGMLIISDGDYNIGQNPVYQAESFGYRINTIGIGDSSEQKDIGISRIFTNNIVYKGAKAPVNVILKSSGFVNQTVSVSLKYEGKTIESKNLDIKQGTGEYSLDFTYEPAEEGIKKYSVAVTSLPGEVTDKNNQKPFFVKVLKNKIKVTIIAGAPSHDVSFIKNALTDDGNIEVKTFIQKIDGSFYEGSIDSKAIEESECIYLIGFPQSNTRPDVMDMLKNLIARANKSLFFIPDLNLDYSKLKIIESFLPFTTGQINNNEVLAAPVVTSAQLKSPVMKLSGSEEDLSVWNNLPPLFKSETNFEKKPESEVLATMKINNIPFSYPLILLRKVYKQKSIAITGYGVWRWKLLAEGLGGSPEFLKLFTGNSVRWLTIREENKKFRVITSKEIYNSGEPVELLAELYDDSYQPVDNASIKVTLRSEAQSYDVSLNFIGAGRYAANVEGLAEGDYKFNALAEKEEVKYGEDNGRFTVGESNLEFNSIRMNAPVLKQIAEKTGGQFYTINDYEKVVENIIGDKNFVRSEITEKSEFQLWNIYYTLCVIIILLALEWFIRKKSGML